MIEMYVTWFYSDFIKKLFSYSVSSPCQALVKAVENIVLMISIGSLSRRAAMHFFFNVFFFFFSIIFSFRNDGFQTVLQTSELSEGKQFSILSYGFPLFASHSKQREKQSRDDKSIAKTLLLRY